ncbi:STAS domain-containing protein [Petroclostridium sp. X23]|uniref:STAS domain-containing protein n=1 Tax=Petroclostridium sp. X23 TaxID=3045146 RepID=UPI0024AD0C43|nr:STAS domain-containing protein [Petroclostridium sp. X23]WHH59348.1 STAS domain-containing protein [Petroclostridium sp. X23]
MDIGVGLRNDNHCIAVSIMGEINISNVDKLRNEIFPIVSGSTADIQFDCKELNYIDSQGILVFLQAMAIAKRKGLKIKLKNVNKYIYKLFRTMNLDQIFEIDIQDAPEW